MTIKVSSQPIASYHILKCPWCTRPPGFQSQLQHKRQQLLLRQDTFPRQSFHSTSMREASIAAPPIDFYNAPPASNNEPQPPLKNTRIIPVSASYFSGLPNSTDNFIHLQTLLRRYSALPTVSPSQAPRVSWRAVQDYRGQAGEPIRTAKYHRMLQILQRLNQIHPSVMPSAVTEAIATYKRDVDPRVVRRRPVVIDEDGKAKGIGRRKTSSAKVYIVPGDGQVLVNGKSINGAFGRIRDRESALWALKVTGRMDRYNVFALASGGGTTGQAEAITLGLAKALMVFEPALKPALRRAGCVTRDPRRVERKKPGRVKARKMPTWVKR